MHMTDFDTPNAPQPAPQHENVDAAPLASIKQEPDDAKDDSATEQMLAVNQFAVVPEHADP